MTHRFRRVGLLVIVSAVAFAIAGAIGVSSASAATSLSATRTDNLMCPITTTAQVYREWTFNGIFWQQKAVVRTSVKIGPNEYWFVGCRIGVKVQLRAGATVLRTIEHEAGAGAKFDPWGNLKWYTFYDDLPVEYLDYSDNLVIFHEQH